ncbi:hypothetical protein [Solirubrobacter soli]|uniref:hypothetical protein n=1 Tax=Solirubrobacter soli TaxID=363832 RepID=UPI0003FA22C3|nr:hypothetical protein [Solirubrobacter soli]
MADASNDERLDEIAEAAQAALTLAEDPKAFLNALDAFRAEDAERFQSELARAGLIQHCRYICRWFCSKHCVFICRKLAGPFEGEPQFDPKEALEFTLAMRVLSADRELVAALVEAADAVDADRFQELLKRAQIDPRYWHQLCHWLCGVKCRRVCRKLCPFRPTITKVGLIPAEQISPAGYGAGPSSPTGLTPGDSYSPGSMGHHPFGGLTHIEGDIFGVANAEAYKVEYAASPAGPWTPMLNPVDDTEYPAHLIHRSPVGDWFLVSDMRQQRTDLANWSTPAPDGLYYLKLTVRNTLGVEFESGLVPVLVDNTPPSHFSFTVTQAGEPLPCCGAKVTEDRGPIKITITGEDANFGGLSIALRGGCNASYPVFSKTYNGNVADTGAPGAGITINYDPWAAKVPACCYVLEASVIDRAIVNNTVYAAHSVSVVRSITIA